MQVYLLMLLEETARQKRMKEGRQWNRMKGKDDKEERGEDERIRWMESERRLSAGERWMSWRSERWSWLFNSVCEARGLR